MLAAVLLAFLTLGASVARGTDLIQAHSLTPPILELYWVSGMQYWSFGRETVITDKFIELTSSEQFSKGYLWNLLDIQLWHFELSVVLQFALLSKMWFADGEGSGLGLWYTTTDKLTYNSSSTLLGFENQFVGLGVLVEHNRVITIVKSDGMVSQSLAELKQNTIGKCRVPALDDHFLKLSLVYRNNMLSVYYADIDSPETEARDMSLCVSIPMSFPPGGYHFGLTAANNVKSHARHKVYSVKLLSSDINDTRTEHVFRYRV